MKGNRHDKGGGQREFMERRKRRKDGMERISRGYDEDEKEKEKGRIKNGEKE